MLVDSLFQSFEAVTKKALLSMREGLEKENK